MGRPTKLTEQLQTDLCEHLKIGNTIEAACVLVGICPETFYEWYNRGEAARNGIYSEFSNTIKKAKSSVEDHHIRRIFQGEKNWQASAWWLERTNPKYRLPREIPPEQPERVPIEEMLAVVNKALEDDPVAKERILSVLEEMK